jgi:predicted ABC-type ATPase
MANGARKPQLYVIAGPNGAGKTTFARDFLPHYVKVVEFVNADLIAAGISPLDPEAGAIAAGRVMLERIHALARQQKDFAFETTLAGRGYVRLFRELKRRGYEIHVFFLWLRTSELALRRIADRVQKGGHDIPADVVRRRFRKGLANLAGIYRAAFDTVHVYDNSEAQLRRIAKREAGQWEVFDAELFEKLWRAHA